VTAIYPARRAIEHAMSVPGVQPVRFFAVLWPLWQVETTASVHEEQEYDVLDWFLVRAIYEAGWQRVEDLNRFYGLPATLAERCLAFLGRIGHVEVNRGSVKLTRLGLESVQASKRYVAKESRQRIMVERFTHRPLPRRFYQGSLTVLSVPRIEEDDPASRTRFVPLFAAEPFRPEAVTALEKRSDRVEYNLPGILRTLQVVEHRDAWLPVYLVESAKGELLAYTGLGDERDGFLEAICQDVPTLLNAIDAEPDQDARQIWTDWLAGLRHGRGTLKRLPSGMWRATLTPDAFGGEDRIPLSKLGSFEIRRHCLLQVWCGDEQRRRQAMLERAAFQARRRGVETRRDLLRRAAEVARQLEVRAPDLAEIRRFAHGKEGMRELVASLDALP
jgi:hypothetical protein